MRTARLGAEAELTSILRTGRRRARVLDPVRYDRGSITVKAMMRGSLLAIARGAVTAAKNPRLLARLPRLVATESRASLFEKQARAAFGGVPRTVPIERLIPVEGNSLEYVSFLDDASPILDLLLLRALMARTPGGRFCEVGTFRGESAIAAAAFASEVASLSLSDSDLLDMGSDPSFVLSHRAFSEGNPKITHVFGDSKSMDLTQYDAWADLVFIDGDHRYAGVASDTRRFWKTRRTEESTVVWHDAFQSPLSPRWEVLAGIAEGLPPERHSELVHVSNTLCVAWLADAASLPTVVPSYIPRVAFSVKVAIRDDWPEQPKQGSPTDNDRGTSAFRF